MPVTVKPIMPFYDDDSGAPPPFPCMLTDQLELFRNTPPSTSLLADEVLSTALTGAGTLPSKNPTSVKPVSRCRSPEPVLARARIASPYSRKTPKPHRAASNASENGSTDATDATSDTDSTSSSLSELSELSEDSKIPKPQGEPGRPGRGGYTLETALGWNQKAYSKFKNYVHGVIDEHLDVTKCASAQNPTLLKLVKEKAKDKFSDLENYSNCWPVNDLIMMHLKYTSSRARRLEIEMAAGKSKKSRK